MVDKTEVIDDVKDKIEDVKDDIKETPKDEQDTAWRAELTSTLATIQTQLKEMSSQKGASAEIVTLTQAVKELQAEVTSLKTSPVLLKSEDAEDNLTQETKTEILSAQTEVLEPPPSRKNNRAWM